MIHLDRNHHTPLSPKQDLILPPDHHKILPWPSLGQDDGDFNPDQYLNDVDDDTPGMGITPEDILTNGQHESQIPPFPDGASDSDANPNAAPPTSASTQPGPITPIDGNDNPSQSHQSSPASVTDMNNEMSPTLQDGDRSSSLSPVPEGDQQTAEPPPPAEPQEKELAAGEEPKREEEEAEEAVNASKDSNDAENDNDEKISSRLSTPLSELSPPPQEEEEEDVAPAGQNNLDSDQEGSNGKDRGTAEESRSRQGAPRSNDVPPNAINANIKPSMTAGLGNSSSETNTTKKSKVIEGGQQQHPRAQKPPSNMGNPVSNLNAGNIPGMGSGQGIGNVPLPMAPSALSSSLSQSPIALSHSQSSSQGPLATFGGGSSHSLGQLGSPVSVAALGAVNLNATASAPDGAENDPRAVLILELNVELLRVCMTFQAKGIPPADLRFQQYSSRLQSNLTWLAAAADQGNQSMPHPPLEPPPMIDFAAMERIRQIYSELPTTFAKEISRRQQVNLMASANGNILSSASSSPGMNPSAPGGLGLGGAMNPAAGMGGMNMMGNPGMTAPSISTLKRERPQEEPLGEGAVGNISKRRDTGENKMMMPPPASIPISSSQANLNVGGAGSGSTSSFMPVGGGGGVMNGVSLGQQQGPSQNHSTPLMAQRIPTPQQQQHPQQSAAQQQSRPSSQQGRGGQQHHLRQSPVQNLSDSSASPSSMMNLNVAEAQMASSQRAKQLNIRSAQQQAAASSGPRQMSPQGAGGPGGPSGAAGMGGPGPGGNVNISNLPIPMQQAYLVLQQPNHPFVNHMIARVAGFKQMPLAMQLQKMVQMQMYLSQQKEHQNQMQQQNPNAAATPRMSGGVNPMQQALAVSAMGGGIQGGMSGGAGGGGFPNQMGPTPSSPLAHQQSGMFPPGSSGQAGGLGVGGGMGGGSGSGTMDPRMLTASMQGSASGMNVNMGGMSAQQRQLLLMQQQQRMGGAGAGLGGGSNAGMGMNQGMPFNPQQQQQQQQQQERMRQLQEQRMAQQQAQLQTMQSMGSPTHSNSPMIPQSTMGGMGVMGGNDFPPALRSNPQSQGIARNAWSPTGDGGASTPSPMTPRGGGGSGVGGQQMRVTQEEYQRMLMQQQQMQAARSMASSPAFGAQQGLSKWQQQQASSPLGMSQQGGSNYGMSPPGSAGGMGGGTPAMAPSPPNSAQNWGGAASGGYPFAASPGSAQGMDQMRHMSATPGPQQQGGMGPPQMSSPSADGAGGSMPNEFDLFNWNG